MFSANKKWQRVVKASEMFKKYIYGDSNNRLLETKELYQFWYLKTSENETNILLNKTFVKYKLSCRILSSKSTDCLKNIL